MNKKMEQENEQGLNVENNLDETKINNVNEFMNEEEEQDYHDYSEGDADEFEEEELPDEYENQERQFNFAQELSELVKYQVVDKYLMIIKDENHYKKNP